MFWRAWVPRLMVPVLVERTGIPAAEKVHSVTKAQRRRLLEVLKCLRIDIQGPARWRRPSSHQAG